LDESTGVNNHARLAVVLRYAVNEITREELVILLYFHKRMQDIHNAVMGAFGTRFKTRKIKLL
jgi:hypothetical protein